ncbi:uncharacterized protein LOC118750031 [Rhagoletis pomonella]|uniref:uncharacterized protein LOC118750031 n=1 Tax=Rhagoletis pomonella TaxID=28610 RepID=UPI00178597DE|nr:uncharacterized protein LOC118750031 [Rhagoletis pomonella]
MGYAKIKNNYDNSKAVINKFQATSKKLVELKASIKFLLKCIKTKLIPNFIKNSIRCNKLFVFDCDPHPNIDSTLARHTHYFHTKILSLLIKHKHNILRRRKQQMEEITTELSKQLSTDDLQAFLESERNVANKPTTILKGRQELKLEGLRNKRNNIFVDNHKQEDWFVNKTKVEFPPDIKALL